MTDSRSGTIAVGDATMTSLHHSRCCQLDQAALEIPEEEIPMSIDPVSSEVFETGPISSAPAERAEVAASPPDDQEKGKYYRLGTTSYCSLAVEPVLETTRGIAMSKAGDKPELCPAQEENSDENGAPFTPDSLDAGSGMSPLRLNMGFARNSSELAMSQRVQVICSSVGISSVSHASFLGRFGSLSPMFESSRRHYQLLQLPHLQWRLVSFSFEC